MLTATRKFNRTLFQESSKFLCTDQVAAPRCPQGSAGYDEHPISTLFSNTVLEQEELSSVPLQFDQFNLFGDETDPSFTTLLEKLFEPTTVEDEKYNPFGSHEQSFDWSQDLCFTPLPALLHTSTPAPKTELSYNSLLFPNNLGGKDDPMLSSIPLLETDLEAKQESTNVNLFSQGMEVYFGQGPIKDEPSPPTSRSPSPIMNLSCIKAPSPSPRSKHSPLSRPSAVKAKPNSSYTFPCPECDKIFTRHYNLKTHLKIHTGEKPHRCEKEGCNRSFVRPYDLIRHSRIHTGEKPFRCEYCSATFSRLEPRNRHYNSKHKNMNQ